MAETTLTAEKIIKYLKQSVSALVDPTNQESCSDDLTRSVPQLLEGFERLGMGVQEKRKQPFSPSSGTKRQKNECNSILIPVAAGADSNEKIANPCEENDSLQSGLQSECCRENLAIDVKEENTVLCLHSVFTQLLGTLKYLNYNHLKSSEEMSEMIETLCKGLKKIMALSRLNFTDNEFRRFLRIADTLFSLAKPNEEDDCLLTMARINKKLGNLFDYFLDHLTEEDSKAEGYLKTYGFISTLIHQVDDERIIIDLTEKIILRIYATTTVLWKCCVSCPDGLVQLVEPEEINLFFFYCQLLQILITSAPLADGKKIQESIHQRLVFLEDDAGSLFSLFPNLAYILYSTILATGQVKLDSKTTVCPLKAIQGL